MFDDLNDLYQQVILDHSKSPRNYTRLEGANRTAQGHNPLCGDHVTMYLRLDGDTVKDISWQGSGCAISRASASILTTAVKGKSIAEVKRSSRRSTTWLRPANRMETWASLRCSLACTNFRRA